MQEGIRISAVENGKQEGGWGGKLWEVFQELHISRALATAHGWKLKAPVKHEGMAIHDLIQDCIFSEQSRAASSWTRQRLDLAPT